MKNRKNQKYSDKKHLKEKKTPLNKETKMVSTGILDVFPKYPSGSYVNKGSQKLCYSTPNIQTTQSGPHAGNIYAG